MRGSAAAGSATLANTSATYRAGLQITNLGGMSGAAVGETIAPGGSKVLSGPLDTTVTGPVTASFTVGLSDDQSLAGAAALPPQTVTVNGAILDDRRVTAAGPVDLGYVHINTAGSGTLTLQTAGDDNHFTRITVANAGADANGVSVTGTNTFVFGKDGLSSTRNVGGTLTRLGPIQGSLSLTTTGESGVTGTQTLANAPVSYSAQVFSGKAAWSAAGAGNWGDHVNWTDTAGPVTGGAPGISGASGDTATFGGSIGASPQTITLGGRSPSLASLTFDNDQGGSYSVVPGSGGALAIHAASGSNGIAVSHGSHRIGAPVTLGGAPTILVNAVQDKLSIDGPVTSTAGLTKIGAGTLILTGTNNISGTVSIQGGTLRASVAALSNTLVNSGALLLDQLADASFGGSITGAGTLTKAGTGKLTLTGADVLASTGPIVVSQGALSLPYGAPRSNAAIWLDAGAALEAAGSLPRPVAGLGTISALGDLMLGRNGQPGQFHLGGGPSQGGTLVIGANAVILLSGDRAILGSQTMLAAGGSLTTLSGAQLGNPTSLDVTKLLTATGEATINGDFINNGAIFGPTAVGQWLRCTQDVQGAGSTSGNIAYLGAYSPGNSPAIVSAENLSFDSTSTLTMEIGGPSPGQYDQLLISGLATLHGTLNLSLTDNYDLDPRQSYHLFSGPTAGHFDQIVGLPSGWALDYQSGSVLAVPEPPTLVLAALAVAALFVHARRRHLRR
jgi:autotransporter-associated beta strand protein